MVRKLCFHQFGEEMRVPAQGEAFYVFKDAILRLEFPHPPYVVKDQLVAMVVQRPLADHRESLAWRAVENQVDIAPFKACEGPEFFAGQVDYACADRL